MDSDFKLAQEDFWIFGISLRYYKDFTYFQNKNFNIVKSTKIALVQKDFPGNLKFP